MRSNRLLKWVSLPIAASLTVALAGCTEDQLNGWMPGEGRDTTNHTNGIISLWSTSWIVLLVVGLITWGLILWSMIAYRRRKGQTGLPAQLRYNMPIETFFTVVPLILVIAFFAFTVKEQNAIEKRSDSEDLVHIEAYGKRWAWDFNYLDEEVYSQGIQIQPDLKSDVAGTPDEDSFPVLHLPVDREVEIALKSRDVIHSFWVIDFLYKKDMIPGKTNYMTVIPQKIGTYEGKCAELCGEYHSDMLFKVKVESQEDYDAYIESLREQGNIGVSGDEYNTNTNLPGVDVAKIESTEE